MESGSRTPVSTNVNKVEPEEENDNVEEKEFRCQAKKLFLTYSQVNEDIAHSDIIDFLKERCEPYGGLKDWIIAEERHKNGGKHFHVLFCILKKPNIRDVRFFDFEYDKQYHPNIKKNSKKGDDWWLEKTEYCMKAGKYWYSDGLVLKMFPNSKGFTKKKLDHDNWVRFMRAMTPKEDIEWPITLPGVALEGPSQGSPFCWEPHGKLKGLIACGETNLGKTTWLETTFQNASVYKPIPGVDYPFDGYEGQKHILFDDWDDSWGHKGREMVINIMNVYRIETHVYGRTRYSAKYWPLHQERIVIILCNKVPDWVYLPDHEYFDPAIISRFEIVHLGKSL